MTTWTPHKDFHDSNRWPPQTHPLYSMFHDARLGIQPWNYLKALEYGELVRGVNASMIEPDKSPSERAVE